MSRCVWRVGVSRGAALGVNFGYGGRDWHAQGMMRNCSCGSRRRHRHSSSSNGGSSRCSILGSSSSSIFQTSGAPLPGLRCAAAAAHLKLGGGAPRQRAPPLNRVFECIVLVCVWWLAGEGGLCMAAGALLQPVINLSVCTGEPAAAARGAHWGSTAPAGAVGRWRAPCAPGAGPGISIARAGPHTQGHQAGAQHQAPSEALRG